MRKVKIAPGEHYHIYNRGNDKRLIFLSKSDYIRFLFLVLYFQSEKTFNNLGFYTSFFKKNNSFNVSEKTIKKIIESRKVNLLNFSLMPNHFHLTLEEKIEGGISYYMQRVLNAYTKYFNTKYKKGGHLFQGPFQAVHVEDNKQLLYLSAYIHKNPHGLKEWQKKEEKYPWSSLQDYLFENRWGKLLKPEIILEQFNKNSEYKKFIKTSSAKELDN